MNMAINQYCAALADQRAEPEHYIKDVGDQWRTTDALFWGINAMFGPITRGDAFLAQVRRMAEKLVAA